MGLKGKIKKTFLYLIFGLALPLLVVEVVMTVFDPYLFKGFYMYDRELGFRVRPYAEGSNQYGFNDREYPLRKEPGVYRVGVIGDSFNWAGGREGNYASLLETKLERRYGGHRVDIVNMGYPMTTTPYQLAVLKRFGLQYNPDMVILGFFMGNDFQEADPNYRIIVINDTYTRVDKRRELTFLGYPVVKRTRLLTFLQQKLQIMRETARAKREVQETGQARTFSEESYLKIGKEKLEFFRPETHRQGTYRENIQTVFGALAEMDDLLKSRGVKFMVAIYPDEFQVNEELRGKVFEHYGLKTEDYDLELGQKILKEFLDSRGIPYVDLLERFREEGKRRSLYITSDTHWNDAGNELAAEVLFENLVNQAGMPAPAAAAGR